MTINEAISVAKAEATDPYAQAYLRAMPAAVEYGTEGLKTQLLYILGNLHHYRGERAREVKDTFRKFLKDHK